MTKGEKMRIELECVYEGDCGRSLNVLCIHCDDCRVTKVEDDEGVDDWDDIMGIEKSWGRIKVGKNEYVSTKT